MALITLLTAEPGKGKTTVALDLTKGSRAVFFCPTPLNKNKGMTALPYLWGKDLKPEMVKQLQKQHPRFRVILGPDDGAVIDTFMAPEWEGYTFVFDDFPQLFPYAKDAKRFFGFFVAGVRHRDGAVIVTTQRIRGILPVISRVMADQIIQVGPLVAEDEAKALYTMGGGGKYPKFKDFYAAISTNPPYHQFHVKST